MSLSPPLALLGLALASALPATGFYFSRRSAGPVDWPTVRLGLLRSAAAFLALVALVLLAGDPADLGLRAPGVGTLVDGVLYGFIAFGGSMVVVGLFGRLAGGLEADPASLVVFDQPLGRRLAVAVTAASVDAVLFFGYVVEALFGLGAGPILAGALGAIGLLLVRARWGLRFAVQWLPGAVVLAGIAVATRSVVVVWVVLLGYDALAMLSADPDDYRSPAETS